MWVEQVVQNIEQEAEFLYTTIQKLRIRMETSHQYSQPGFTLLSYITELFSLLNLEKHGTFYTYAELCSKGQDNYDVNSNKSMNYVGSH